MKVYRSMILDAPIDRVWTAVRAFDGVVNWNPGVTAAHLENGKPTETGTIRHLDIVDGSVFRETLLTHSDHEFFYTYDIIDGPLPVSNYISTHQFLPITHTGQTLGIWRCTFDCASNQADAMNKVVGDDIYIGGMLGLIEYLGGN